MIPTCIDSCFEVIYIHFTSFIGEHTQNEIPEMRNTQCTTEEKDKKMRHTINALTIDGYDVQQGNDGLRHIALAHKQYGTYSKSRIQNKLASTENVTNTS